MIAWLSSWLREVMIILLLAIFADLILPSQTMQRYVKMVFSLLIILAILSPIVELLHSKSMWKQIATTVSSQSGMAVEVASLSDVQKQGEALAQYHQKEALSIVSSKVAAQMEKQLSDALSLSVLRLVVDVREDEQQQAAIHRIDLIVSEAATGELEPHAPSDPGGTIMQPIAPVVIDLNDKTLHEPIKEGDDERFKQQITQFLTSQWVIQPQQIHIQIKEGEHR